MLNNLNLLYFVLPIHIIEQAYVGKTSHPDYKRIQSETSQDESASFGYHGL